MEDTTSAVRAAMNACAELMPQFDARFKALVMRYPYVAGFFFGMLNADLRPLPSRARHSRHERDVTLGLFYRETHLASRILEWQSEPDPAMAERARFYIGDQVHVLGSRELVRMRVLHLLRVSHRGSVPDTWPWQGDDVIYTWENIYLPDYPAEQLLIETHPALAVLSSGAAGGTDPGTLGRALDLILALDCSEPHLISAIALHRFLAELHSIDRDQWTKIMNEKNPQIALRVEESPIVQQMVRVMERRAEPVREELRQAERRAGEAELAAEQERAARRATEQRAADAEQRAADAEQRAADAEQRAAEAEEELNRLRAQLAAQSRDDEA